MGKIGTRQLANKVSDRTELSASAVRRVLALAFEAITEELAKGNKVTISGFGSWRTKVRTPRAGRHPQTGRKLSIPARTRVLFKPGSKMRASVEYAVDPEIFLGAGIAQKTELEGALARLFGARPETFHLDGGAGARIRDALGSVSEEEAKEFFSTLTDDPELSDLLAEIEALDREVGDREAGDADPVEDPVPVDEPRD